MIEPNTPIRFTGGKLNGFNGIVAKVCDQFASVNVTMAGKTTEVVEAIKFMTPQDQPKADAST